jgi:hypothetical protein
LEDKGIPTGVLLSFFILIVENLLGGFTMGEAKNKEREKQLNDALQETITGYKVFEVEDFGTVKVRHPSIEEGHMADYYYTKAYNKALMDDIPINEEMEKIIRKRGLWTEEDDKKLKELEEKIGSVMTAISKVKGEKAKEPFYKELNELQNERIALRNRYNSHFNYTVESIAEQQRVSYLTWACTYNTETNERLWPTYEDFKKETNQKAVADIAFNLLSFLMGLDDKILSEPLQELEEGPGGEDNTESNS